MNVKSHMLKELLKFPKLRILSTKIYNKICVKSYKLTILLSFNEASFLETSYFFDEQIKSKVRLNQFVLKSTFLNWPFFLITQNINYKTQNIMINKNGIM